MPKGPKVVKLIGDWEINKAGVLVKADASVAEKLLVNTPKVELVPATVLEQLPDDPDYVALAPMPHTLPHTLSVKSWGLNPASLLYNHLGAPVAMITGVHTHADYVDVTTFGCTKQMYPTGLMRYDIDVRVIDNEALQPVIQGLMDGG